MLHLLYSSSSGLEHLFRDIFSCINPYLDAQGKVGIFHKLEDEKGWEIPTHLFFLSRLEFHIIKYNSTSQHSPLLSLIFFPTYSLMWQWRHSPEKIYLKVFSNILLTLPVRDLSAWSEQRHVKLYKWWDTCVRKLTT